MKVSCDEDDGAGHTEDDLERPIEMNEAEYRNLVEQVAELTEKEAQEEWLESARFGEIDILRALAMRYPRLVDDANKDTGNTALHMAAANGHVEAAKLLMHLGHSIKRNGSGNTPLHFAAINSQYKMVLFLTTQDRQPVDVLEQNNFGRSSLTEGFTSQNEMVIKALLEHESANEDRLLSTSSKSETSITHSFFDTNTPLKIRELAITNADNPFADSARPDKDTTGLSIWSASLVLARWLREKAWGDSSVLELGAGCGVPGLAVATCHPPPKIVYLTDLNPDTVNNMRHNISLNNLGNAKAMKMDWDDKGTWPEERLDFVLGSDLVYQKALVPLLANVVRQLLKKDGTFFYVAPESGRDGLEDFIEQMKEIFPNWKREVAPRIYHSNPLANGDDEQCFLHFQELSSLTYVLYTFQHS